VRFNLHEADVTLPVNLMHYPVNLQAPDNFEKAAEHPIGTGPFKFVSWTRWTETKLVRFENYWAVTSTTPGLSISGGSL
jgi:peptide/nickel transport system substrate-binding protein